MGLRSTRGDRDSPPSRASADSLGDVNTGGRSDPSRVRLAELVAALSLGIDLGFGQPMEHVLRQCMIALRLAECVGLDEEERSVVYYTALLVNVGCHSDAHEQAKWFGDDIALKSGKYDHELGSLSGALATLRLVGSGNPPLHRFRVGVEFAVSGRRDLDGMIAQHAALARRLAEELGLSIGVQEAVGAAYEQWDGKGWPGNSKGDDIPIASRLAQIGEFVEVAHRIGGTGAAIALAEKRAGSQFDPTLAAALCANAETILDGLDAGHYLGRRDRCRAGPRRPALRGGVRPGAAGDRGLRRPQVALHAGPCACRLGAGRRGGDEARARGRRGRDPAPGGPGPRPGASRRVERHLGQARAARGWASGNGCACTRISPSGCSTSRPRWPRSGAIAVQHRERLDGSGYPRGLSGGAISMPARILGAADAYQSMCEPRPHREALLPEVAAKELRAEVKAGRMDGDVVEAVLGAAGHRVARRREGPAGLTAREVDVLRLVLAGLVEQGDRRPPGDLAEDRPEPHRAHLREDRRLEPGGGQPVRDAARPAPRRGRSSLPESPKMGQLPHASGPSTSLRCS